MSAPLPVPPAWDLVLADFGRHLETAPRDGGEGPLSPYSRRAHLMVLRRVARGVSGGPADVDVDQLRAWVDTQDWTPDLTQRTRLALRVFYSWAVATGVVERAPIELPGVRVDRGWDDAAEGFASWLAGSDRSPATSAGYLRHVGWLAQGVVVGPWDLDVHGLSAWLNGRTWSRDTRRKVLVSLRAFYAWGVEAGLIEWAPVAGLQSSSPAGRSGPGRLELTSAWREPGLSFISWLQASHRSAGTVDQRRWYLLKLSNVSKDPWTVTTAQLALWLSNPDWSPQTTRAARSTVRAFYRWAVLVGRLEKSPADALESVRCPRALPRPIPDGPLRQALAAADDRSRLALMLGALAGLRRAEIAALHTSQVSPTEILVVGKGGHHRRVAMHPLLWEEISAELARRRLGHAGSGYSGPFLTETGYLFPSDKHPGPIAGHSLAKALRQHLPVGWTPHTLRHRFATMAYAEQRDILAVQQLLGHAKPETTAVYAAVPDGAMRTAVLGVRL